MPELKQKAKALEPKDIAKLELQLDEIKTKLLEMDHDISEMKSCQLELIEKVLSIELTAPYLTDVNLAQNVNQDTITSQNRPAFLGTGKGSPSKSDIVPALSNIKFVENY